MNLSLLSLLFTAPNSFPISLLDSVTLLPSSVRRTQIKVFNRAFSSVEDYDRKGKQTWKRYHVTSKVASHLEPLTSVSAWDILRQLHKHCPPASINQMDNTKFTGSNMFNLTMYCFYSNCSYVIQFEVMVMN